MRMPKLIVLRGNNFSFYLYARCFSITAEPASLQATEMKKENCSHRALEQSKVMFTQAQQRLQATLLKNVFLKAYANTENTTDSWGYLLVLFMVW